MTSKIVYLLCAASLAWSGLAGAQGFPARRTPRRRCGRPAPASTIRRVR